MQQIVHDHITLVRDPAVRGDDLAVASGDCRRQVLLEKFLDDAALARRALQAAMLKLRGNFVEVDEELLGDRPEDGTQLHGFACPSLER